MILTAQQVKEKLKIGDQRLHNLMKDGTLKPTNERKPGAKKFYARFNSADVNRVAAEIKVRVNNNGHYKQVAPAALDEPSVKLKFGTSTPTEPSRFNAHRAIAPRTNRVKARSTPRDVEVSVGIKLFEIRDRATCIPAMAVRVSGEDGPIMRRAGFGDPLILLTMLAHPKTEWDPYNWSNRRTMGTAHNYIAENWDALTSGQVIDVRVLLGEATEPATAECV